MKLIPKNTSKVLTFTLSLLSLGILLIGCQESKSETRTYTEKFFEAPKEVKVIPSSWSWTAPEGYAPSQGDAMRIATFKKSGVDLSLLSLPGDGGGVSSNLKRWAKQLGHEVSEDEMITWAKSIQPINIKGNLPALIFDFSQIQDKSDDTQKSMLASIVHGNNEILFVKLSASLAIAQQEKANFTQFVQSLEYSQNNSEAN